MKTFIAVPGMDQNSIRFTQSLTHLQRSGDTVAGFEVGSLIYAARNNLAKAALKAEADYVLWLDSDMTFPENFLGRMMKTVQEKKIDFLSGLYFRRSEPYSPVIFDKLEPVENGCSWTEFKEIPKEIFKIGGCGFGGVLMSSDVILSVAAKFGRMFDPLPGMGEDLSFCWRARECGYDLWCDPSLEMGHVGTTVITRGFYEAYRMIKENKDEDQAAEKGECPG